MRIRPVEQPLLNAMIKLRKHLVQRYPDADDEALFRAMMTVAMEVSNLPLRRLVAIVDAAVDARRWEVLARECLEVRRHG